MLSLAGRGFPPLDGRPLAITAPVLAHDPASPARSALERRPWPGNSFNHVGVGAPLDAFPEARGGEAADALAGLCVTPEALAADVLETRPLDRHAAAVPADVAPAAGAGIRANGVPPPAAPLPWEVLRSAALLADLGAADAVASLGLAALLAPVAVAQSLPARGATDVLGGHPAAAKPGQRSGQATPDDGADGCSAGGGLAQCADPAIKPVSVHGVPLAAVSVVCTQRYG
jgi:hypothetical protein